MSVEEKLTGEIIYKYYEESAGTHFEERKTITLKPINNYPSP